MDVRPEWEQVLGAALALATLASYAWALDRVRRVAAAAIGAWWVPSARDGVNLAGAGAIFAGLWRFGFPAAAAFPLACLLALAVYGADYAARRVQRPALVSGPLGTLLAGLVLLFGEDLAPAVAHLLEQAFASGP